MTAPTGSAIRRGLPRRQRPEVRRSGRCQGLAAAAIVPAGADATVVAEKQAQAQKILDRAKAGEDFAKLAREVSDDAATRAEGGDLGYFGKDMLPKAIEEMVFAMKPGDVRGPVRADRGFHVIKLVDRKTTDPKPLDEVKDDIRMQLRGKDMERQTKIYLAELRKKTLVDIRY